MEKPSISQLPELVKNRRLLLLTGDRKNQVVLFSRETGWSSVPTVTKTDGISSFAFWEGVICPLSGSPVSAHLCLLHHTCPEPEDRSRCHANLLRSGKLLCRVPANLLQTCFSGENFPLWWAGAEKSLQSSSISPSLFQTILLGSSFYGGLLTFYLAGAEKIPVVGPPTEVLTYMAFEKEHLSSPIRAIIFKTLLETLGWAPLLFIAEPEMLMHLESLTVI